MMTKEQFIKIIEGLKRQKIKVDWMVFTGGEPTLWPHLVWAIKYAKENADVKYVRVITNAIDREAKDYGDADIIAISHYGAINRYDISRLRKQLGRKRCKVQYVVHLPWPFRTTTKNPLPADCGCMFLSFHGDRAYPCGSTAGQETSDGVSVEEPFYETFVNRDPGMNEMCKKCLANRKNRRLNMTNFTLEVGVWDSAFFHTFNFGFRAILLRKIYNHFFRWWK